MDLQLSGKRALVTGSSVGLGESIARALAKEGVEVVIHGRDRERADRVAADIEAGGGRAVVVLGDLTQEEEVDRLIEEAERSLGQIEILVNNAGGASQKQLWENTSIVDWAAAYDRNVLAAVRTTTRLVPKMRQIGWGRVINISSLAGMMPPAVGPDYSACKAAMNNMTVSLSKAVAAEGVTVNAISPGTILTPKLEAVFRRMAGTNGWADPEASWPLIEQAVLPHVIHVPLGKVGRAEDVANAVAFLCSPLASYITGIDLRIDGGVLPTM